MSNDVLAKVLYGIGIGLIITSGVIAVQVYYNEKHSDCVSNPLVYAAQQYKDRTGFEFIGTGSFVGVNINSPTVTFSSEGVSVNMNDGQIDPGLFNFSK